jgi:hypothetical protein
MHWATSDNTKECCEMWPITVSSPIGIFGSSKSSHGKLGRVHITGEREGEGEGERVKENEGTGHGVLVELTPRELLIRYPKVTRVELGSQLILSTSVQGINSSRSSDQYWLKQFP